MLEGLVTNLLNRVLGVYVKNFDPKQLKVGIWNGDVKLSNLELRKEALDQLHLPLNVVEGHLGELTLSIPWSNLRGKPVRVNIENVFILAAPREDADYDAEEEEKRANAVKIEKLESAELLKERNVEGLSKEEQQKQQSFTASLTTAIIDNLQVTVRNIHVRYEDSISDPGHPFATGLTLQEFSAISTDEKWKPTFIQSNSGSTHKLATLGSLAIYWDTDTSLMGQGRAAGEPSAPGDVLRKFKAMVEGKDDESASKHQFILKPVSGHAGIEMDKSGKTDRPRMKARLFFDELGFVLDEDQYRDSLMLVDLFHYFVRHQEHKKFQPKAAIKEDPRAWLRFAGQSVVDKVHDKNRRWSWEYFKERRDDRRRYIECFKKKKKDEKLSAQETRDIEALEKKSTYEDLRFWRSLARNQLRKENVGVKKPPPRQSWSSWVWGGAQTQAKEDDTAMSEEQRNELYSAIDWDEKKAIADAVELPKETVKLQLRIDLQTGSFMLKRSPKREAIEVLKLMFDSFSTTFLQRPESFLTKVQLKGMRLYDGTVKGNLFPQMVTVKDGQASDQEGSQNEITNKDVSLTEALNLSDENFDQQDKNAFFALAFEQHPLDGSADSAVDVKLRGMEIIYNPRFVVEVVNFFKPPERNMESIGALMESANEAVEGIRKQTRAGLEFALEEHKTINAHLDLQAPLIIIPDSVTQKSSLCLILDAGHASLNSELVDKETLHKIQSKQKQQYTDEDYKQLEGLMYDKFNLKLQSTQVLIGPSIEATRAQLGSESHLKDLHIVDRINMDFLIETCIVPKSTELTKMRITGKLPVLHASISGSKYRSLMRLLDVAIPKFDEKAGEKHRKAGEKQAVPRRSSISTAKDVVGGSRTRSKSFQFAAQAHELIAEEDDDEQEKVRKFQKPSSGQEGSSAAFHQRNFEFRFVVEKLQGSLHRSDPEGQKPDELLAELIAEGFSLDFYQRQHDMIAEVGLRTLVLEDHVEPNPLPEFKNILSSVDSSSHESKDLFQLKFAKVDEASPEFMPVYEGIATNLDVSVSTINLIVTRKTLLTLLDFVIVTFAPPTNKSADPENAISESSSDVAESGSKKESGTDRIRIKANLQKIAVILNNDGIGLATLSLSTASVGLTLMGKTMRLGAKVGSLSLVDDVNQGAAPDSPLRQLLAIQGDELADFSYETFDTAAETYPGHDSTVYLRSGSVKVNFVTEPFRKIMDFAVKFGKMQAIFNAARQAAANQAGQIQETASKMHFDIQISTPIIVFPTMTTSTSPGRDTLTAYLGEIYATNKFLPLDDSKGADTCNEISTGIRNIRLLSQLYYEGDETEELELLDKVDLGFNVNQVEHKPGYKRPDLEVKGSLSNINLRVTSQQLKLVLGLSRSIPAAFATTDEDVVEHDVERQLPSSTVEPAKTVSSEPGKTDLDTKKHQQPTHLGPELGSDPDKWTKLDMVFEAGAIGLELIQDQAGAPVRDLSKASLTKFALNDTNVKLRMLSDGGLESELLIRSFTIQDTRNRETNKFRKIMSLINNDITQQFMASVTISGGTEKDLLAILSIDSPRVILALDYLFAVQSFVNSSFQGEGSEPDVSSIEDDRADTESAASTAMARTSSDEKPVSSEQSQSMSISFRVNLVSAQVVLLANPTINSSEAIVLSTKQVIVARQHATTIQVEKVGMFLCRMDRFDTSRLRILDDFSIATSLDVRGQDTESSMTNIQVDVEPLVLHLSLRDVLLAMQIASKATSSSGEKKVEERRKEPQRIKELRGDSNKPSTTRQKTSTIAGKTTKTDKTQQSRRKSVSVRTKQQSTVGATIMDRERMNIHMGGIRVVLIGDLHELPILDWSVKQFGIDIQDWSGAMTADATVDTFFNIYNFSKSAWEPLIEPWSLGFHMSQDQNPSQLSVDVFSRKSLELTLTTATIALASKSASFLSTEEDVLSKPRGSDAPYRIRNHTGFKLNLWAHTDNGTEGNATAMEDGEESPWRFEDPTKTRETLAPEGATGIVGIKLEGSGFDSIDKIPINREGETIYSLTPRKDRVLHRMLVEVQLGTDSVKYITFRSPLVVENATQIPIELGVYSPEEGHLLKIEKIAPGESRPAPVGAAFMHSLVVRPDQGFGYSWSNERLFWKDLLKRPTSTITCRGEQPESSPPFYFQMHAVIDKTDPLTSVYPYMRIRLFAPVELQNLLPYDFKYRIYDKSTKKDWSNFLRKGGISPGHVVNLSHLLLLSIDMQDTPFRQSEFAIINSPDKDFSREKTLIVKDKDDLTLRLKLHYFNVPDSGGAFKVTIYSPYIILNRTGLELDVRSKSFMGSAKTAAGQAVVANHDEDDTGRARPFMFSFPTDDQKNRALLKVGDSAWSKPQSFNAIGSDFSVSVSSAAGKSSMQVGVAIAQGEGKYSLTNVVTIAPRFVVKNRIGEDLDIREPGNSEVTTLKPGVLHPLRYLKQGSGQQLSMCFPGLNNQWSSPFYISNVGRVHTKLAKNKERQQLIKAEIMLEDATIFIHLSLTQHWPFSIQNESSAEVTFYQANPNVDEDEDDRGSRWRPIRYRLPPRSIMPYAWDYPASKNKDMILDVSNKQRTVKLAEIGPQIPFRLPPTDGVSKTLDIDVVADGPKQTLVLSDHKDSLSLYKQKSGNASKSSSVGFEIKDVDSDVTFKFNMRLAGVGVSLVNKKLRELLYLTLRDIELKFNESKLYQTVNLTTKWIQIDNQLYGGIFPILLYPSVVPKTGKELEAHPVFHSAITRVKNDSYGVLYIKYFTILLQQLTVEVDEDFIFALLDFSKIPGASWNPDENNEGKLCDETLDLPEPQREEQGQDVYFELLHLQPMQIDVSFVRTERINAEDTMAVNNPFMFFVNVFTMSLGNVNDAPLRYNALLLENARISPSNLVTSVQSHYVQESVRQLHIVLGSADFLGNPVGLFNNVSSGVADIFYEPYQGLVMTDRPQDLGLGIAKGASSFVKKSVFGFSDSMAKFTGSMAKGLAAASLDKEFQDQRRMSKSRNRPKHALYGITSGGNAFATSMASGIGGLARHPLEGAEKEGVAGFAKGVGKGLLGIATKPAIAAFDLASNVAEGVRNTTTVFDSEGLDRVRLTRFIASDGIVRPYASREALGQFWLKTLDNGRCFNEDYIAHLELPGKDLLVMLTYNGIMLVRAKKLQTEWDVPLREIQRISKERSGLNVLLKEGRQGPFLPVGDEGSRNWLYRQVAVAVNAYNERYQAKG
ncbi:MAG: hypothetical protein M1828_003129 [Chrysothrix sp. TS-e1954]|nr:MAG: hypothetical protein M1828_003129 [Chrysothrix sp. TS-e1954]